MSDTLTLVPLGGVGEIGKNMTALMYDGRIIVMDAGLKFPDEEMYGVDIVIPDFSWLIENADRVEGVFLTHGHEDHIGALPYLLKQLSVPVWGTRLTLGLVRPKLDEHGIEDAVLNEVQAGDRVPAGPFEVEFIAVSHSIPDSCALAVHSPAGVFLHTSDFKFDPTPVDGRHTDVHRLAELGKDGVLALMSDCTNVERPGFCRSERMLSDTFDRIFARCNGRIIVACFASNIHRIQQVADISIKYNRQMAVIGRSMEQNVATARSLGYLQVPDWALLDIRQIESREPYQVTIMTTGSQGEPLSVLSRLAMDDHRKIRIQEGDTVIISARPIPGNENLVQRVINNLFKRGAQVIYDEVEPVHVSGHAHREELRLMVNLTRPKYVVPIHGEYRHLVKYAELLRETGYRASDIIPAEIGDIVEFTPQSARVAGKLPSCGSVMVDGLGVGDVGDVALRDRSHLASDGVLVVVASVDRKTGELLAGPDLLSRGFMDDEEAFLAEAREVVREIILALPPDSASDRSIAGQDVRSGLAKFVNSRTRRRPVIIPVIMEV